jgi:hypothetical protein
LKLELNKAAEVACCLPFKLRFAVSNFMGYGLYKENIFGLDEFMARYDRQIYSGIKCGF